MCTRMLFAWRFCRNQYYSLCSVRIQKTSGTNLNASWPFAFRCWKRSQITKVCLYKTYLETSTSTWETIECTTETWHRHSQFQMLLCSEHMSSLQPSPFFIWLIQPLDFKSLIDLLQWSFTNIAWSKCFVCYARLLSDSGGFLLLCMSVFANILYSLLTSTTNTWTHCVL